MGAATSLSEQRLALRLSPQYDSLRDTESALEIAYDELSAAVQRGHSLEAALGSIGITDSKVRMLLTEFHEEQLNYKPIPMDTSGVSVPMEVMDVCERLARNTHEQWSQMRVNQGWVYGPVRNDDMKQHPCLIAYDLLTENERDFDRSTSLNTIKVLLAMGYVITKL